MWLLQDYNGGEETIMGEKKLYNVDYRKNNVKIMTIMQYGNIIHFNHREPFFFLFFFF